MKISLFWRVLPVHIAIIGVLIAPLWHNQQVKADVAKAAEQAKNQIESVPSTKLAKTEIAGKPVRILLPRLNIDISVVDGSYSASSNSWSVAQSTANYATNTVPVNNVKDQTLIYGHWSKEVFGPTKQLEPGDIMYVYTDNQHIFSYKFTGSTIVRPTDTQLFSELQGEPGLILMTCDGAWANDRRLMRFELVEAV